jgi:hypothetical protein
MRKPREQLAQSDAAFIGRLVARERGRLTFAVTERIKGEIGDRVVVGDRVPHSPMSLRPAPGVEVGLFLRRHPQRGLVASDCDVVTPEAMRAARASGRATCERPQVRSLRARHSRRIARGVRVHVLVEDPDGEVTAVDIAWGDGAVTRIATSGQKRSIVKPHRYRSPGRFRIAVVARSAPDLDCGFDEERSAVHARGVHVH